MDGGINTRSRGIFQSGRLIYIDSQNLNASSSNILFSNIPQNYKHLYLTGIARTSDATGNVDIGIRMNGDTGSNYSHQRSGGSGGTFVGASSGSATLIDMATVLGTTPTANAFGVFQGMIYYYNKLNTFKSYLGSSSGTCASNQYNLVNSGTWASLNSIFSLTILPISGTNLTINTTIDLYGIY